MMIWLALASLFLVLAAVGLAWVLWPILRELEPGTMSERWQAVHLHDEGRTGTSL